jgi:poly-gamma-glutamate capsule biosynthesis protein CapA/YwtB (metallophosphatase superfamily)
LQGYYAFKCTLCRYTVAALTAAGVHFCALANNHTMDWGEQGLRDTLEAGLYMLNAVDP